MAAKKTTSPVKGTTQHFLEIEDVFDDVLLLKDNSACCVIEIGAVNFYLLSAEEQNSMIYAYSNLLNSLSFPVQVVIISKKMDISIYLDYINAKITEQRVQLVRERLTSYQDFIKNIIKKNSVLEKRFFFVVPFNPLEMGAQGARSGVYSKEYIASRAKTSLYPKRDHLLRLLSKIGLRAQALQKQELVELYFNLYNPSATGRQLAPIDSYTNPLVSQ